MGPVILVLGACGLIGLYVLSKAWRGRTSIYRYDVRSDQTYVLPNTTSTVPARLDKGLLEIGPSNTHQVTLLELKIRSTLLGHWFEPYLEIQSGERRYRQPFERGGRGVRFVDLSQFASESPAQIHLCGHHLVITDPAATVHRVGHSADLVRQKILVLATHPDDAEIAGFGLYADRDAYVITITAGEAGDAGAFSRFHGTGAYREKGRIRAWNSLTVPMLGGVSIDRTANLGYFDGTLEAMRRAPNTPVRSITAGVEFLDVFGQCHDQTLIASRGCRRATWHNLVADLEQIIRSVKPGVVVAPHPLLDVHPDHKMSTVALVEALKNLDEREGSLLLYTNHLRSSDRYPFGRSGDLMSLPPGGNDIYFDGLVSVPLDELKQSRKHMALDAMIDLRQHLQANSLRALTKQAIKLVRDAVTDGNANYFRQAVRANELFFEVRMSSLHEAGIAERITG